MNYFSKILVFIILISNTAFSINHRNKNYHKSAKPVENLIFNTSFKRYTAAEVKNDASLYFVENYDSGFPKTYVTLENLPENMKLKLDCNRPVINKSINTISKTNDLIDTSLYYGRDYPYFIISGRGVSSW